MVSKSCFNARARSCCPAAADSRAAADAPAPVVRPPRSARSPFLPPVSRRFRRFAARALIEQNWLRAGFGGVNTRNWRRASSARFEQAN